MSIWGSLELLYRQAGELNGVGDRVIITSELCDAEQFTTDQAKASSPKGKEAF